MGLLQGAVKFWPGGYTSLASLGGVVPAQFPAGLPGGALGSCSRGCDGHRFFSFGLGCRMALTAGVTCSCSSSCPGIIPVSWPDVGDSLHLPASAVPLALPDSAFIIQVEPPWTPKTCPFVFCHPKKLIPAMRFVPATAFHPRMIFR